MCRLFGFRSAVRSGAHRSLVLARNSLAEQAKEHQHGWGIGYYPEQDPVVVHGVSPASDCCHFRETSHRLSSNTAIVHVRKATVGRVGPENLHPFTHGRWMFAHNGTIYGFAAVKEQMRAQSIDREPTGATDSETLFYFLLGRMERAGLDIHGHSPVDLTKLETVLREGLAWVNAATAENGEKTPAMNFLLTNGRIFVANRYGRELWFSTQKLHCQDAATCTEPDKVCLLRTRPGPKVNHLLVASERIGDEEIWEEVAEGTMLLLGEDFQLRQTMGRNPHQRPVTPAGEMGLQSAPL